MFSLNTFSQTTNLNSYDDLIKYQTELKSESGNAIVWGHFGSWGKFGWNPYKDFCLGTLNQKEYSGLLSGLNFKLFTDSTTTYFMPISKNANLVTDFKPDDIITLKIKVYRNCKKVNDKVYFLIEEIL